MIRLLKKYISRRPAVADDLSPVCIWNGAHSGDPVCFVAIGRDCGHIETGSPACLAHLQMLLRTGGVSVRKAPCFREDCDVVGFARVEFTTDIPGRDPS